MFTKTYRQSEVGNYYPAICGDCSWRGISRECHGGEVIADTGDYGDIYCPRCGSNDIEDDRDAQVIGDDDMTLADRVCATLVALFFIGVLMFCFWSVATAKPADNYQFPATERVRLLLESTGLSNKEAYLLLGDAIHEHVSTVCPDQGIEP